MKPIGLYKSWNDTTRENKPNVKYRRFGWRTYIRECKTWTEYHAFIRHLRRSGYTTSL